MGPTLRSTSATPHHRMRCAAVRCVLYHARIVLCCISCMCFSLCGRWLTSAGIDHGPAQFWKWYGMVVSHGMMGTTIRDLCQMALCGLHRRSCLASLRSRSSRSSTAPTRSCSLHSNPSPARCPARPLPVPHVRSMCMRVSASRGRASVFCACMPKKSAWLVYGTTD